VEILARGDGRRNYLALITHGGVVLKGVEQHQLKGTLLHGGGGSLGTRDCLMFHVRATARWKKKPQKIITVKNKKQLKKRGGKDDDLLNEPVRRKTAVARCI
jgi:hypothetical protein